MFATLSDMSGGAEISGLDREFNRKQKYLWRVCDDALEPHSFRGRPRNEDREIREALAELCQIYWRPIFFSSHDVVTRPGRRGPDAGFFCAHIKGQLASESRSGSRAIPFPAAQVASELSKWRGDRSNSRKRGGGISFISWDAWIAEAPSQLSLASEARTSWPAERVSTRHGRRRWYNVRFAAFVKNARRKDVDESSRC